VDVVSASQRDHEIGVFSASQVADVSVCAWPLFLLVGKHEGGNPPLVTVKWALP